ncbi:histone deacetylase [Methanobacterium formicicum]|uniref:Histone deacetylase superfamily protein n=1 Tax=Methanobacterium formicicum (strain DSM 3637 / PP1) TaxID=1204725 RepID=K2R2A3_METFP|nr:histone deacetylase [Methanobacterium formicicum]EKF85327.1 histone deacetylase superfamily protein [Methanobacterium formicicum DSM 3637]
MISLVYSPEYARHQTGHHPENQERLEVMMKYLIEQGEAEKLDIHLPVPASDEDLLRVHTKHYLNHLQKFTKSGGGYLDFDTFASPESYQIAKLAAGGAITASQLVFDQSDFAYSMARPPGHHATADSALGFCLINNLAVALEYMRKTHGLRKFVIVDFDAHYGNGTAEIFYNDPQVLYISIHQDPRTIFPGKGFIEETGSRMGEGFNLNIPLPPGSGTSDYIYILEKILEPACRKFQADFYFLDVGFDGHQDDPLSSLQLDDDFYPWITSHMQEITPKMVLILEGGYSQDAMARSNLKMIKVLKDKSTHEDQWRPSGKLVVKDETKKIFKRIQDTFSPFFTF